MKCAVYVCGPNEERAFPPYRVRSRTQATRMCVLCNDSLFGRGRTTGLSSARCCICTSRHIPPLPKSTSNKQPLRVLCIGLFCQCVCVWVWVWSTYLRLIISKSICNGKLNMATHLKGRQKLWLATHLELLVGSVRDYSFCFIVISHTIISSEKKQVQQEQQKQRDEISRRILSGLLLRSLVVEHPRGGGCQYG